MENSFFLKTLFDKKRNILSFGLFFDNIQKMQIEMSFDTSGSQIVQNSMEGIYTVEEKSFWESLKDADSTFWKEIGKKGVMETADKIIETLDKNGVFYCKIDPAYHKMTLKLNRYQPLWSNSSYLLLEIERTTERIIILVNEESQSILAVLKNSNDEQFLKEVYIFQKNLFKEEKQMKDVMEYYINKNLIKIDDTFTKKDILKLKAKVCAKKITPVIFPACINIILAFVLWFFGSFFCPFSFLEIWVISLFVLLLFRLSSFLLFTGKENILFEIVLFIFVLSFVFI